LSLVCFNKKISFFEGLKFICSFLGLDYYHDFDENIPESIRITKLIYEMQQGSIDIEEKPLKPINHMLMICF